MFSRRLGAIQGAKYLFSSTRFWHLSRLETDVYAKDGYITIDIEYEAGRRAGEMITSEDGNTVTLRDPYIDNLGAPINQG